VRFQDDASLILVGAGDAVPNSPGRRAAGRYGWHSVIQSTAPNGQTLTSTTMRPIRDADG
jgi:hypothetical protein